jgi:hypothetical protein
MRGSVHGVQRDVDGSRAGVLEPYSKRDSRGEFAMQLAVGRADAKYDQMPHGKLEKVLTIRWSCRTGQQEGKNTAGLTYLAPIAPQEMRSDMN